MPVKSRFGWWRCVRLSTSFELHGDGSEKATLVAMIARQEQESQVQGVSTLEWVDIICREAGWEIGGTSLSRQAAPKHSM